MLIEFTCRGGKPLFKNQEDLYRYCVEHEGEEIIASLRPKVNTPAKKKMFAFYHANVLQCAMIGYTAAGYPGMDTVKADYLLRAELAKDFIEKPDGSYEPVMLDKRNFTKARLLKYLQDCIFFIESDLQVRVPSADEYRAAIATGRNFIDVK